MSNDPFAGLQEETPSGAGSGEETGASLAAQLAGGGEEGFVLSQPSRRPGAAPIAFVVLALLAGGGLWMMHKRTGGPATASAADPQVIAAQSSIRQFLAGGQQSVGEMEELLDNTEQIKQRFLTYNEDRQVPLEDLKTNPFWHETVEPAGPSEADLSKVQQRELARREAERLQREQERAEADFRRLELQSLFIGTRPMCQINGKLCQVGQEVEGFTVEAIHRDHVIVVRGESRFELRMRQGR